MSVFKVPLDIQNRALQHCGASRISSTSEVSKNQSETLFAYNLLRDSEMRRNVWTFATRRAVIRAIDTTTMLLVPGTWAITETYLVGSIVQWNGQWYSATRNVPVAQEPDLTGSGSDEQAYWTQYFGPRTVTQWTFNADQSSPQPWASNVTYAAGALAIGSDNYEYNSVTNGNLNHNPVGDGGVHWTKQGQIATNGGYFAGELVYYPTGPAPEIYVSLNTGNSDIPTTVPLWDATAVYDIGDVVVYSSVTYQSTIDLNVNQTPTGAGDWVAVPATQPDQRFGINWLKLGHATVRSLQFTYPIGSGPITQSATRNVYVLPYGFLREAPQDPKAGSTSYLGAPSGLSYDDWVFENGCIVTREVYPITLRFVADITDVALMDPMFCEGLAARVALEVCEPLTQSTSKLKNIGTAYDRFMGEARLVNGIEQGATESPEDDYITCRR